MKASFKNQNLNFLPDEIIQDRRAKELSKSNIKISVIILLFCVAISSGLFAYRQVLNRKNNGILSDIEKYNSTIADLKDTGYRGFVLGVRLDTIKSILEKRVNYSQLIEEMTDRVPFGVVVKGYSVSTSGNLSLKALADENFAPISNYQDKLLEKEDDEKKSLFKKVEIGTASLDKSNAKVNFDFKVLLDLSAIYENVE
jgi:Tfp pilus assembly protein PilN